MPRNYKYIAISLSIITNLLTYLILLITNLWAVRNEKNGLPLHQLLIPPSLLVKVSLHQPPDTDKKIKIKNPLCYLFTESEVKRHRS